MENKKVIICGNGEIGKSLAEVLSPFYSVTMKGIDDKVEGEFDVMHIAYPYSKDFIKITQDYIKQYKPKLTIINSTVKVGTTKKLGKGVVHSAVNGRHPQLAESIKTFVKFIGANNAYDAFEAVQHFNKAGVRTQVMSSSDTCELAKMLCTTYLSWNVLYMKEVAKECEKYGVPFHECYTEWHNAYNEGYTALGEKRFFRPILFPIKGPIGGHCCINNCHLLDNDLTKVILEKNKEYEGE